ncbi:MAG: hypothetical protein AAGD07_21085 [Planctomycetota bacterium]
MFPKSTVASDRSASRPWRTRLPQKATVWVMQSIYEQDFGVFSYVDDFVIGFESKSDVEACLEFLRERLGQFGLALHPYPDQRFRARLKAGAV